MASLAVAIPQLNGALSPADSPISINSATKRKRDASDDCEAEATNGGDTGKPPVNGLHAAQPQTRLIRDFYDVLQSLDAESHAILKRALPDGFASDGEPQAKRNKSEDSAKPATIDDKVRLGAYDALDDLVSDVVKAVKAYISELESSDAAAESESDQPMKSEAIARALKFKNKAHELFRRELAYPLVSRPIPAKVEVKSEHPSTDGSGVVLMTYGMAPTLKPVFTSLQKPAAADGVVKELSVADLPNGIAISRVGQSLAASTDRNSRSLTLGELFPSPRNLPPLQPPKAIKNTTKSNVLTFYHPELTEKSKYRAGSYFSMNLSTGNWLDYSNATPTTHGKTKQRERAQSLAGVKPSSTELEMSEMEALFRGAFSSFAPCKDDAGAVIPSSQVGHIWWQRIGRRNFDKMAEAESAEDGGERVQSAGSAIETDIDESLIEDAIENWDDSVIDPSLDEVLGKKSEYEKTVDDILEEVSDLIETLASHQRNRNLTLPTSQDRYSTDPVNGDMLRHGSLSHQPNEDEMATYRALKAHLSLIISMLPPYAVARLNSDKLEELNVSLKIEVRTDEYKGVMEEDEPARLARQAQQQQQAQQHQQQQQQQQQAAQQNVGQQRAQHRSSSVSSTASFAPPYGSPFQQPTRPMAVQQQYPHTPARPQGPTGVYPQRPPSAVPIPQPHPSQTRAAAPQPYRPANNYGVYAPQLAKSQTPYGHSSMQYPSSPGQARTAQAIPNYSSIPAAGTPNHRYTPGYASYPQHQPMQTQQPQPPAHATQPSHPAQQQHVPQPTYMQYTNGNQVPRTMSPQVPPAHSYSPSPTPPQQHQHLSRPPYGTPGPGMPPNAVQHHSYASTPGGTPGLQVQGVPPQGASQQGGGMPSGNGRPNMLGFQTHLNEGQQRQMLEQANARVRAQQTASGHMGKVATQGEVAGLAGIGLGGGSVVDVHKMAVHKMQQQQQQQQQLASGASPSPQMSVQATLATGPSPVNGMMGPPAASPVSMPGSSASPAPGMGFQPPA